MSRYQAYPDYKDSGVESLSYIPRHWVMSKLKYFSSVSMGQSPNSSAYNEDGIGLPFLQGNAEFTFINPIPKIYCDDVKKSCSKNDLLFSVRAPVGALNIADQVYGIGRGLCAISSNDNSDNRFLWWLLQWGRDQLDAIATGSTFESVSVENVKNLISGVPVLSEQTRIAAFLDHETAKIDQLIEKQQQLIKLLEEKRQAVISHAVTKGLNPDTPMKDSGVEWLGDVPASWFVSKFNYEIDYQEGPGILAVDFHDEGVPLLRIQNVKSHFVTNNFKTYLDPAKVISKWNHFRVKKADLIISCSATTGLVAEVDSETVGSIPYTGLIRLRPRSDKITKDFIRFIVQSDMFFEQVNLLQTGATIQHFGPAHLQQMHVAIPSVEEQQHIVNDITKTIHKLDKLTLKANLAINLMKERRTALISAAVTGKIDVRLPSPPSGAQRASTSTIHGDV